MSKDHCMKDIENKHIDNIMKRIQHILKDNIPDILVSIER